MPVPLQASRNRPIGHRRDARARPQVMMPRVQPAAGRSRRRARPRGRGSLPRMPVPLQASRNRPIGHRRDARARPPLTKRWLQPQGSQLRRRAGPTGQVRWPTPRPLRLAHWVKHPDLPRRERPRGRARRWQGLVPLRLPQRWRQEQMPWVRPRGRARRWQGLVPLRWRQEQMAWVRPRGLPPARPWSVLPMRWRRPPLVRPGHPRGLPPARPSRVQLRSRGCPTGPSRPRPAELPPQPHRPQPHRLWQPLPWPERQVPSPRERAWTASRPRWWKEHPRAPRRRHHRETHAARRPAAAGRRRAPRRLGDALGLLGAETVGDHHAAERAAGGDLSRPGVERLLDAVGVDRACRCALPSTSARRRRRSRSDVSRVRGISVSSTPDRRRSARAARRRPCCAGRGSTGRGR